MVVGDLDQCLVAGTQVTMADRTTKPIEVVAVGDEVLSCYGSGDFRPAPVLRVHESRTFGGVSIKLASGRKLVSTPEHMHFAGYLVGSVTQPQFVVGSTVKHDGGLALLTEQDRLQLSVVLCAGQRDGLPLHQILLRGGADEVLVETCSPDMGVIAETVARMSEAFDVRSHYSARLASNNDDPLPFTPAESVRRGC
jgi:hypothetical protein